MNEIGGACGTCEREKRSIQVFGGQTGGNETTWKT
jgi:hypothetical protein